MVSRKKGSGASRKKARKRRGTANSKMSMKLLVDTKAQRVLYAEAGKDVVDFLFSLLALPLSTVASLLTPAGSMVGSVGNLYGSIDELDDSYMCRDDAKAALLTPTRGKLLQLLEAVAVAPEGSDGAAGFVQGVVTYTVMDDLKVAPMSTISGITLLNSFGITDIRSLQEKTVQLGYAEGLKILRASLRSKTVLMDVFLGRKKSRKKKRKAGEAFRHEGAPRVVRRCGAWAGPWHRWYLRLGHARLMVHAVPAARPAKGFSVQD